MRSSRNFPATSQTGLAARGKSHIRDFVCGLACFMRTGSRLWADPRPIRGKSRSTPRGFRLSGRTASDETATRDCNEGRAPMPVGALFLVMDRVSGLSCERCQAPEDENFRTKVGH